MAQPAQTNAPAPSWFMPATAGMFEVHARAIGVIPEDFTSSVSVVGGKVAVTATPAPELDLSYHITDHLAVEIIAGSTRHELAATGTVLGHVDVGSTWVLPPTLTALYHPAPRAAFDPYLGGGLALAFFYDTHPAGPVVTKYGLSNGAGGAIQAGFDESLGGPWVWNFDVKQIFLSTKARINGGGIVAKTSLSPTVIGSGIGYRF